MIYPPTRIIIFSTSHVWGLKSEAVIRETDIRLSLNTTILRLSSSNHLNLLVGIQHGQFTIKNARGSYHHQLGPRPDRRTPRHRDRFPFQREAGCPYHRLVGSVLKKQTSHPSSGMQTQVKRSSQMRISMETRPKGLKRPKETEEAEE